MIPRIPLLPVEEALDAVEATELPHQMADLSIFRVLLKSPRVAGAVGQMLTSLLGNRQFDRRLRELVIMRIGWATGASYEWTQHWRVATSMGIDEADLLGVRDWRDHVEFGPVERAVLAATDETLDQGFISETTLAECSEHLEDEAAVIGMVVSIANWTLISSVLRSLRIPLEDGVTAWPPSGVGPENSDTAVAD